MSKDFKKKFKNGLMIALSIAAVTFVGIFPFARNKITERKAISMTRKAHTLNPLLDNETAIRKHLERQTGEMVVYGWKAKRIDSRIAVAAYSYSITLSLEESLKRLERNIKLLLSEDVKEIEERSYVFEVNLEGGIVRFINEDDRLMNKYAPGRGLGPSVNKTVEKWLSTVPKKNEDGEKH